MTDSRVPTPFETDTQCTVDGCDMPRLARGYCSRHYMRWWRYGTTDLPDKVYKGCTWEDKKGKCTRAAVVKGYCRSHYTMARRKKIIP